MSEVSVPASLRQQGPRLVVLAVFIALLLAFTYRLTREQIANQQLEGERQSLNELLPPALHDNDLLATAFKLEPSSTYYQQPQLLALSITRAGYIASLHGKVTGVILPFETAGYGGTIVLRIGIAVDGSISGVRVLQHSETAGLGDNIDIRQSPWLTGFEQSSLTNTNAVQWHVKIDGGKFDQFAGATITPRAVTSAIHNALLFFDTNKDLLLSSASEKQAP